jgi:hypothetical protein
VQRFAGQSIPGHLDRLFELDRQRILDVAGWPDEHMGTITAPTLVVVADRDVLPAEQAASGGDLRTVHATVPFLLRFLGE